MSRVKSHSIDHNSEYYVLANLASIPTRKSCSGVLSSQITLSSEATTSPSSSTNSSGKFEKLVNRLKKRGSVSPTTTTTPTTTTITGTGDKAVKRASQSSSHRQLAQQLQELNAQRGSGKTSPSKSPRSTTAECQDYLVMGRLSSSGPSSTVRLNSSFQRHHSYTYGDDEFSTSSNSGSSASRAVAKLRSYASGPSSASLHSSEQLSSSSSSSTVELPANTSLAFKAVFGELAIKCVYREMGFQGDISLVRVDENKPDYQRLAKQLESIHGFSKRGLEMEIVYTDKDGDKVRIRDTESLVYACEDWRRQVRRRKGNCGSMSVVAKGRRQPC